jgi:hypothetical protein
MTVRQGEGGRVGRGLPNASTPLDGAAIAAGFRQGKRVEKKIAAVLLSLARLGHVVMANARFEIRRAA